MGWRDEATRKRDILFEKKELLLFIGFCLKTIRFLVSQCAFFHQSILALKGGVGLSSN